jgi:mitochondrial fission protein ELM1
MQAAPPLRVWALLGQHRGDNNQVLALAEALGLPFETKSLQYNRWRWLQPRWLGASLRSLIPESRALVTGEAPDLIISTGRRSVPVVQWIRRRSGGRTRSVHIGYPRLSPDRFDLVVSTPEYPVPDHPKVMRIAIALTRRPNADSNGCGRRWLGPYPAPRHLLVLGGPTLFWSLSSSAMLDTVSRLLTEADEHGGSLLVIGSPRTPPGLLNAVRDRIAGSRTPALLAPTDGPSSYRDLIAASDAIFVTGDSVAMVSEAIVTGKPVGLIPVRATLPGKVYMGLMDWLRPGRRVHPRDLRYFWSAIIEDDRIGTLDGPRAGVSVDPTGPVVARVLKLLNRRAIAAD